MRTKRPIQIGPLIIFPKHYVPRRDGIWQAGKNLARRTHDSR